MHGEVEKIDAWLMQLVRRLLHQLFPWGFNSDQSTGPLQRLLNILGNQRVNTAWKSMLSSIMSVCA